MASFVPSSKEPASDPKAAAQQVRAAYANDEDDFELSETLVARKWRGTEADRRDMSNLGKVQELRRNFHFLSTLGLACCLVASWEIILTTTLTSLTDGGTAGLLWGYIIVIVGFYFVYLSIAEMASMAPTSGGQYHWVSELAPRGAQKFLSYIVGWLCFTGWQGAICGVIYLCGTVIQGLIILNNENYVPQAWHGTMLVIAVASFAVLFNTVLAKRLPLVQILLLALHVLGFLAITIVLWVMAPTARASDVWLEFTNAGGWNSYGTATMVGLISPILSSLGYDCAVHMSEEVKDASATIPKSLIWSFSFNSVLGFLMAVTIVFALGNVEDILASATGYPFIQVFFNATGSYAGTNVMTALVILALVSSAIAEIATASRTKLMGQLWSFARDKGMPGYRWMAHISPGWNIPLNAVLVSLLVTSLLSLINIGSSVALNAVLSLAAVSLITSYVIVIGCLVIKRLRGQPLPARRWSLGQWGLPINILALCFLAPIAVFVFFPVATPVVPASMNWAIVMYFGIMGFATVYYIVRGRKEYLAPVALVKREELEQSGGSG